MSTLYSSVLFLPLRAATSRKNTRTERVFDLVVAAHKGTLSRSYVSLTFPVGKLSQVELIEEFHLVPDLDAYPPLSSSDKHKYASLLFSLPPTGRGKSVKPTYEVDTLFDLDMGEFTDKEC